MSHQRCRSVHARYQAYRKYIPFGSRIEQSIKNSASETELHPVNETEKRKVAVTKWTDTWFHRVSVLFSIGCVHSYRNERTHQSFVSSRRGWGGAHGVRLLL